MSGRRVRAGHFLWAGERGRPSGVPSDGGSGRFSYSVRHSLTQSCFLQRGRERGLEGRGGGGDWKGREGEGEEGLEGRGGGLGGRGGGGGIGRGGGGVGIGREVDGEV